MEIQVFPKNLFRDSLSQCIYETKEESVRQVRDSALDQLFELVYDRHKSHNPVVSVDVLIERDKDFIKAMNNLIVAIENPGNFIQTYRLK